VTIETYAALADRILDGSARLGPVRLVAVDGPSGSGKTTFAARVADAFRPPIAVEVVPTDAFLDGWAAPLSVWPAVRTDVLDPVSRGEAGAYRPYDWTSHRFSHAVVAVPVPDVLILEGVTSARREVRPALTLSVFVTGEPVRRFARALARDGADIASGLRKWQMAETMYFETERTADGCDLLVDGTTDLRHDPGREYVRLHPGRRATTGGWCP
jgi:uridine kinase